MATTAHAQQVTRGTRTALDVDDGSVVTFTNDGRSFTRQFHVMDNRAVDIAKIAAPGFPTKPPITYVVPDPSPSGG